MTKSIKKYTKEFKQEAITLALKSSSTINTATELGIPVATLYNWIHELKKKVVYLLLMLVAAKAWRH